VEIQSRLPEIDLGEFDQVVWYSKGGNFSSSETWERIRKNTRLLLGIGSFGFLLPSLSTPLCFGLLSMGLWLQERRCVDGATWVIARVLSLRSVVLFFFEKVIMYDHVIKPKEIT
jgi:hypothetical protein